jgi:hypothetical protein
MTNQGDQLAAASYPNPNDAKAALGVLVGDALDQSREHLAVGGKRTGGNPVDSVGLKIGHRSTRSGPLIHCTTKLLRQQPAIL